jgi:hypothetical protein
MIAAATTCADPRLHEVSGDGGIGVPWHRRAERRGFVGAGGHLNEPPTFGRIFSAQPARELQMFARMGF